MIAIKPKFLVDTSHLKDILAKNKAVKDNGLLKSLGEIKKLGEDDHDDAQKLLEEIAKLSGQLKKSKEAAATPAVSKFLAELSAAADTAQKDVAKAKAETDKKGKAEAEAEAKKKENGRQDEDEEGDESNELLTTKMIPLLRDLNKGGHSLHVLIASAGKDVSVLISRKPISPARRKMLADDLGLSGGIKYIVGHCLKEDGIATFALKTPVAGMTKKLKLALLAQTGMRMKLRCRGEDGETDEDFEEEAAGGQAQAGGDEDRFDNGRPRARGDDGDTSAGGDAETGGERDAPHARKRPEDDDDRQTGDEAGADAIPESADGGPDSDVGDEGQGEGETAPEAEGDGGDGGNGESNPSQRHSFVSSVGRGGKNLEEDVRAVQRAINHRLRRRLKVDGRCGPTTLAAIAEFQRALGHAQPDGRVEPNRGTARALLVGGKLASRPELAQAKTLPRDLGARTLERAPLVWRGARGVVAHNIDIVKKGVQREYSSEHPDVLAEIERHVQKVDAIMQRLDTRLSEALERAKSAAEPTARKTELAGAKAVLADYIGFVKSEPLIDHIDNNPFGVRPEVRKTITDSLTHIIRSIG